MSQTKRCSECGEVRPKTQFPRSLLSLGRRSSRCLLCSEKFKKGESGERLLKDRAAKERLSQNRRGRKEGPGREFR